jgi:hypothetical protein
LDSSCRTWPTVLMWIRGLLKGLRPHFCADPHDTGRFRRIQAGLGYRILAVWQGGRG